MRRVFVTRPLHPSTIGELNERYDVDVQPHDRPATRSELLRGVKDAEGLICLPYDRVDGEVINSAGNLKAISTYSVGFDHIDIGLAKAKQIRVGHTPDVLTDSTADLAFCLLLDLSRRVSEGDRNIRGGRWKAVYGPFEQTGTELGGKTLGILGMGRIGTAVARRARAFGMSVKYHSRRRLPEDKEESLGAEYVSFNGLLAGSDMVSIHAPHTSETDRLFDSSTFMKMKRTSFLINTARGGIVNEGDLVAALECGTIAGAGLDVFEVEPLPAGSPLLCMDNVVLAPHIGSATDETRIKMGQMVVRNLDMGMNGERPVNSVGY